MGIVTIKLPDVGEGIAEAELVEWSVNVGELVKEDQLLAAVMTDKATVEIPSPHAGKIVWLGGEIGQQLAIGSDFVKIEVAGAGLEGEAVAALEKPVLAEQAASTDKGLTQAQPIAPEKKRTEASIPVTTSVAAGRGSVPSGPARPTGQKPLAAPSVRQAAHRYGVDLTYVHGSGPAGRITHDDLAAYVAGAVDPAPSRPPLRDEVRETKVIGLRRKIAERMSNAKRRIPHITIVEEVDVTALEALREQLNAERREGRPKLTVLPFLMAAISRAVAEQPGMNALFDDDQEVVREFSAVHIGIATQTKSGLMVPVVRHCESRTLWDTAAELLRVADAARNGSATRDELTGSTISISSLGPLGAIATTPIINYPEVAIVGVNRMDIRPKWDGNQFVPRRVMNLSSSFDHRVIDGWDAAVFVKRLKTLLEAPALLFVEM